MEGSEDPSLRGRDPEGLFLCGFRLQLIAELLEQAEEIEDLPGLDDPPLLDPDDLDAHALDLLSGRRQPFDAPCMGGLEDIAAGRRIARQPPTILSAFADLRGSEPPTFVSGVPGHPALFGRYHG